VRRARGAGSTSWVAAEAVRPARRSQVPAPRPRRPLHRPVGSSGARGRPCCAPACRPSGCGGHSRPRASRHTGRSSTGSVGTTAPSERAPSPAASPAVGVHPRGGSGRAALAAGLRAADVRRHPSRRAGRGPGGPVHPGRPLVAPPLASDRPRWGQRGAGDRPVRRPLAGPALLGGGRPRSRAGGRGAVAHRPRDSLGSPPSSRAPANGTHAASTTTGAWIGTGCRPCRPRPPRSWPVEPGGAPGRQAAGAAAAARHALLSSLWMNDGNAIDRRTYSRRASQPLSRGTPVTRWVCWTRSVPRQ
jgi:hypothetical protein